MGKEKKLEFWQDSVLLQGIRGRESWVFTEVFIWDGAYPPLHHTTEDINLSNNTLDI